MSDDSTDAVQRARRELLADFIRVHFGSVNAFANALDRKQPQLNETLRGSRSFGEKLARSLESEVDALRRQLEWRQLPPLRFDASDDTQPKLAALIAYYEALPNEEQQDLLIRIAGSMAQKSGQEAALPQVGRDSPARALGSLQPHPKSAPKKRHGG